MLVYSYRIAIEIHPLKSPQTKITISFPKRMSLNKFAQTNDIKKLETFTQKKN